jgi:phosphoglycerol geranylgeranyltransferase
MNNRQIIQQLRTRRQQNYKSFAVLVDPDQTSLSALDSLIVAAISNNVDYFFVGGSLLVGSNLKAVIRHLKQQSNIPVIIFPGSNLHFDDEADAILFLSLISGRNPDFLIGQHVTVAPLLKRSPLQILPTGYMLVDSGTPTTVSYVSNTNPIPYNKPLIAACTAMAGEMLGLQLMYLDAGSGAKKPVALSMINAVRKATDTPLIVGGGIRTPHEAIDAFKAGADLIVVGNAIEENPGLITSMGQQITALNAAQALCT